MGRSVVAGVATEAEVSDFLHAEHCSAGLLLFGNIPELEGPSILIA